jgi:hypothetical protein
MIFLTAFLDIDINNTRTLESWNDVFFGLFVLLVADEIGAIGNFATLTKVASEGWMPIKANRNRPRKKKRTRIR